MPGFVNALYQKTLTFLDANGTAINVSTYDLGLEIYKHGSGCRLYTLTDGDGIDDTDAATGVVVVSLTPAQMTQIGPGVMRLTLYRNYTTDATRSVLASGSDAIESRDFDAGGGMNTLKLRPAIDNLRIRVT